MCEELIRKLRTTAKAADFFGAIMPAAENPITALYNEAADAIEKLNKRIDFLMSCIYEAEDSLDRGADNDWARAALEKAERGQDYV
jgi:hypothetical protein